VNIALELPSYFHCWRHVSSLSEGKHVQSNHDRSICRDRLGSSTRRLCADEHNAGDAGRTDEPLIQSDQVRASKMIGSTVYDVQNRNIGKVSDLVLNKNGTVMRRSSMSARS
jgi:hypothetical protein